MERIRDAVFENLEKSNPNKPLTAERKDLIEQRLLQLIPDFRTPCRPTYALMIQMAINGSNENGGSSEDAISKYIKREYDDLPLAHTSLLRHHLKKLSEKGEVVFTDHKFYRLQTAQTEETEQVQEGESVQEKASEGRSIGMSVEQNELERQRNCVAEEKCVLRLQQLGVDTECEQMQVQKGKLKSRRRRLRKENVVEDESHFDEETEVVVALKPRSKRRQVKRKEEIDGTLDELDESQKEGEIESIEEQSRAHEKLSIVAEQNEERRSREERNIEFSGGQNQQEQQRVDVIKEQSLPKENQLEVIIKQDQMLVQKQRQKCEQSSPLRVVVEGEIQQNDRYAEVSGEQNPSKGQSLDLIGVNSLQQEQQLKATEEQKQKRGRGRPRMVEGEKRQKYDRAAVENVVRRRSIRLKNETRADGSDCPLSELVKHQRRGETEVSKVVQLRLPIETTEQQNQAHEQLDVIPGQNEGRRFDQEGKTKVSGEESQHKEQQMRVKIQKQKRGGGRRRREDGVEDANQLPQKHSELKGKGHENDGETEAIMADQILQAIIEQEEMQRQKHQRVERHREDGIEDVNQLPQQHSEMKVKGQESDGETEAIVAYKRSKKMKTKARRSTRLQNNVEGEESDGQSCELLEVNSQQEGLQGNPIEKQKQEGQLEISGAHTQSKGQMHEVIGVQSIVPEEGQLEVIIDQNQEKIQQMEVNAAQKESNQVVKEIIIRAYDDDGSDGERNHRSRHCCRSCKRLHCEHGFKGHHPRRPCRRGSLITFA